MADNQQRPSKKRKLEGANAFSVKIGGKTLSLEGYLAPPRTKTSGKQVEKPAEAQSDTLKNKKSSTPAKARVDGHSAPATGVKATAGKKANVLPRTSTRWGALSLPITSHKEEIQGLVRENDVVIIVGETGSGKSTQVPQFLVEEDWCQRRTIKIKARDGRAESELGVGGTIAITQPRRVAATTLAHRVSREVGTPLGKGSKGLVGYSVRFDHNIPRGTKIKYMTEGMLLQELLRDPDLKQYSAIVVDEIHERSIDVDLLSGFLKQLVLGDKSGRGGIPLKVIVMSATANTEGISRFFGHDSPETEPGLGEQTDVSSNVRLLKVQGRQYPVELVYAPAPVPDLQEALIQTIFKIHMQEPLPGDILAFLTGQSEIEAAQKLIEECAATLASNVPKVQVFPLFGQLSIEAQHHAFQPAKGGFTRKIVLATNIAETSVTVPGVSYVVDCGKAKVKQFRAQLGMESLLAKAISKSSAIQRAGRAGRERAGKCYRLYTEDTFKSLREIDPPEILRADVMGAVLSTLARGINDILSFPLMDRPDANSVEKALVHLLLLGAVADDGSITDIGRKMAMFPVSAPYGRVLIAAADPQCDCLLEAIDIMSCITAGGELFQQLQSDDADEEAAELRKELYRREGDLLTYLTTMQRYAAENADRIEWCRRRKINVRNMKQALNIRKQLRAMCLREQMLAGPPAADPQPFVPLTPGRAEVLVKCFLRGFALKTALLAPDSSFVTTQGKNVVAIHPSSVLHGQKKEAIMFLEHVFTQRNYAKKVTAIQAAWVAEALQG